MACVYALTGSIGMGKSAVAGMIRKLGVPLFDADAEVHRLQGQGPAAAARLKEMRLAQAWLHRDDDKIPQGVKPSLTAAMGESPSLAKLVAMREELRALWTRTNVSAEQLVADLQAWCRKAEESGIAALQEFSMKLRAAQA